MSNTLLRKPKRNSSMISAADLLTLVGPDNKSGFIRQKHISRILKSVKWHHRFVVLAQTAVYVYANEMSKSPIVSIPLLGYIAVKRENTSTCAWVFALVPGVPSLKPKIFACSSDIERKDWMRRIKMNLYTANNIKRSSNVPKYSQPENMSPEDKEYSELEFPIKSTTSDNNEAEHSDSASDCDEDEDATTSENRDKSVPCTSSLPLPQISPSDEPPDDPPRYSAIVQGKEHHYYTNLKLTQKAKELGLEKACRIVDEAVCRDRDKCTEMLKKTKRLGTYLIRKSRTGDYSVLVVLVSEDVVKEYKIEESYGMYHLHTNSTHEFPSIDALLAFYTTCEQIPQLNTFLVWGYHETMDDVQKYETVDQLWS